MNETIALKNQILSEYIVLNQNGNDYLVIGKEFPIIVIGIIAITILVYYIISRYKMAFET